LKHNKERRTQNKELKDEYANSAATHCAVILIFLAVNKYGEGHTETHRNEHY